MDLHRISAALDDILDTTTAWTDREFKMYQMLQEKVTKFSTKSKSFVLGHEDRENIIANFTEQPWYQKSKHMSVIANILKKLEISDYSYQTGKDNETRLKLKLSFGDFSLNVKYHRTDKVLKYFVYYENSKLRGDVCYIDTTGNIVQQKEMKLPDYPNILSIVNTKTGTLSKSDVVHIASEMVHYYDQTKEISNVNMGMNYPVSLSYLSSIISPTIEN